MTTKTISTVCYIVATVLCAVAFLGIATFSKAPMEVAGLFFVALGLVFGSV